MSISSRGYGNDEVAEAEWAQLAGNIGCPYTYSSAEALRPYPAAGVDRGVAFMSGTTYGWGVMDAFSNESMQLPTVSSGSQQFMCVARRRWGAGQRTTTLESLLMSGASPVGRSTSPGAVDDQPLCLASVTAGSSAVTNIVDLRTFAAKAYYVPNLNAALLDPQLGARYVLPTGDRYIAMLSGAGTVQVVPEKQPDAPVIPTIPRVRTGVATNVKFSTTGWATIDHNLGYTPSFFSVHYRNLTSSTLVLLNVGSDSASVTNTQATIIAKRAERGAVDTWVPYASGLAHIDWLAVG